MMEDDFTSPNQAEIVDLRKALERSDGDGAFLQEMYDILIEGMPKRIKQLREILKQGDSEALAEQAHAIKGTTSTLGANRIADVASRIEMMAKANQLNDGERLILELKTETAHLENLVLQPGWMEKALKP